MIEPFCDLNRAVLITNTQSGANLRYGVDGVHRRAAAAGLRHFPVDDIEALDNIVRGCARADIRLIIVNAGDGTVCRLLDIIRAGDRFTREPVLALLRGGTTNMIHDDVGWTGRPEPALVDVLSHVRDGRCACRERYVLRVHQTGPGVACHGFFFATHAMVRAILRTRSRLHALGGTVATSELLAVAAMLWRLLRRRVETDPVLSPVPLEIRRNDDPWREVTHVLLMATSLNRIILGARPLGRGQQAGWAELNWPGYKLLPWLWRFTRGRLEALQSISLRGEFAWILDGEIHEHRTADGVLSVTVAEPARFLIKSGKS